MSMKTWLILDDPVVSCRGGKWHQNGVRVGIFHALSAPILPFGNLWPWRGKKSEASPVENRALINFLFRDATTQEFSDSKWICYRDRGGKSGFCLRNKGRLIDTRKGTLTSVRDRVVIIWRDSIIHQMHTSWHGSDTSPPFFWGHPLIGTHIPWYSLDIPARIGAVEGRSQEQSRNSNPDYFFHSISLDSPNPKL